MKRLLVLLLIFYSNNMPAQSTTHYIRIASILVDSTQTEKYNAAVKEHAEAAVAKEPGVLTLYAVYDKERPNHVTVFEIYASLAAYQSHIKTPHFLKYKDAVKDIVQSLTLTDVVPISLQRK